MKNPVKPAADMTVLDVVAAWRQTEAVFKEYDKLAGECICCMALFETVGAVAARYNLPLDRLLADLNAAVQIARDADDR